jgi:colanic acid/amylovoran biosynthesis glycosyltransferase
VGRTTNWLYDHLRSLPRYTVSVLSDCLDNREEFPLLHAWTINHDGLGHRIWNRISNKSIYPVDRWRLKRLAPRVLHSHFGYVAVWDYRLRDVLKHIPWFVSFYGADIYELGRLPEWRDMYGQLFGQATRVLALGPEMAAKLRELGCSAEKITIHPLGVDVASIPFKVREIASGEPLRILFAGTFREKKGIPYLIQAAALVRRVGIRFELHLVGDAATKPGDQETKIKVFRAIDKLGLNDVVFYQSYLSFQDLISLALRSHIFVAPSVTAEDGDAEGTPFVLQQMMATGMPVITTSHSDIPYLFGECKNLLVPERDAQAIAERVQFYAEEPNRLKCDGIVLRNRVRQAFDTRQCAARLSDLYDTVSGIT